MLYTMSMAPYMAAGEIAWGLKEVTVGPKFTTVFWPNWPGSKETGYLQNGQVISQSSWMGYETFQKLFVLKQDYVGLAVDNKS